MAAVQFPDNVIAKSVDTGETVELAKFTDTGFLGHIRVYILSENLTGNETITLELRESDGTTVRSTSDPLTLSSLTGFSTGYWLGWARFDFNKPNLGTGLRVFATISDYTRVADTSVLNYLKTYLNPTYATPASSLQSLPADIQIFKYV